MSIKNSNDLISNRTRDLPECTIVPQPTTLPRARKTVMFKIILVSVVIHQKKHSYETCQYSDNHLKKGIDTTTETSSVPRTKYDINVGIILDVDYWLNQKVG
jgi:hypothetical protein